MIKLSNFCDSIIFFKSAAILLFIIRPVVDGSVERYFVNVTLENNYIIIFRGVLKIMHFFLRIFI